MAANIQTHILEDAPWQPLESSSADDDMSGLPCMCGGHASRMHLQAISVAAEGIDMYGVLCRHVLPTLPEQRCQPMYRLPTLTVRARVPLIARGP
jgi:hypothetical protein